MARRLLEAGADWDLEDEKEFSPLNWASSGGHTEGVKLLLVAGAKKRDLHNLS